MTKEYHDVDIKKVTMIFEDDGTWRLAEGKVSEQMTLETPFGNYDIEIGFEVGKGFYGTVLMPSENGKRLQQKEDRNNG
jgi:hypothetical protein